MQTLLLQFFSALVGGLVVYVFGVRKLAIEARTSFIVRQMSEFYSPLAGYRKRIRAQSEVREKVASAATAAWQDVCRGYDQAHQAMVNHDELIAPYRRLIDYDNQQLRKELIPLYRKMLDAFTDQYWLADADTRSYYRSFLEFIEIWERYLVEALPDGVVAKLGHSEGAVQPFYDHLESRLSALQSEIKAPPFWRLRL